MSWLITTKQGCVVTIKATPRAAKSGLAGVDAEWVRIRLQAPPVDGKANVALIGFLAKTFSVPKRSIEILSGDTSRLKRVKITGVTAEQINAVWSS